MRISRLMFAAVLLGVVATPACAQFSATLFGGYVVSEGIDNSVTGERANVGSGVAFSAAGDYQLDASRHLQLFYGQQSTTLEPGGGSPRFDLDVRYLHIGGTYFFDGPIGRGPYAVGGLGATYLSPKFSGSQSETRGSLNVGFGYLWPIGTTFALRAEARAFLTFLNSSSGLFCSGGCTVVLSGEGFLQGQAMLGLTARF